MGHELRIPQRHLFLCERYFVSYRGLVAYKSKKPILVILWYLFLALLFVNTSELRTFAKRLLSNSPRLRIEENGLKGFGTDAQSKKNNIV